MPTTFHPLGQFVTTPGGGRKSFLSVLLTTFTIFLSFLRFCNPGQYKGAGRLRRRLARDTMKSGALVILVGLLALWAELTLASGQKLPGKSGTCPTLIQNNDTQCGQFCGTDNSCPGSERCCQNSCGQQCMLPLEVSPGYCPRVNSRPDCSAICNTDQDCASVNLPRKKCCSSRCGKTCQVAEEEHPGVCPKRELVNTFVPCNDTCRDDRECPLTQKCCFTDCSRGCLDSVRSDICQLPPKPGPCFAAFRRYHYDPSKKKCILFTYGGCQGNSNNFDTKEACLAACGKISPEVCKLPMAPGRCEAYSEFYFYNSATRKCEIFIYGGCGGNGNRFSTKLECMMVCGRTGKGD